MERPEKSCEEGGVLGGHPGAGDVACSLRNTRTAKLHSFTPGSQECCMRHTTSQSQKLAYRSTQRDIRSPVSRTPIAMEKLNN
jgi:hypothetical protein